MDSQVERDSEESAAGAEEIIRVSGRARRLSSPVVESASLELQSRDLGLEID